MPEEFRHEVRSSRIEVCPCGTGRRVAYHHGLIGRGQTALGFDPKGKAAQETRHLFGYLRRRIGLSGRPRPGRLLLALGSACSG